MQLVDRWYRDVPPLTVSSFSHPELNSNTFSSPQRFLRRSPRHRAEPLITCRSAFRLAFAWRRHNPGRDMLSQFPGIIVTSILAPSLALIFIMSNILPFQNQKKASNLPMVKMQAGSVGSVAARRPAMVKGTTGKDGEDG
ncbi:hypothetical protein E2C01_002006 [Portunus trituberculatus]|uniref:Uncharacterized protein n=1 Tax=Portunus trituberculatus TaxID=210409 RepID=A0A5B7CJE7_PORTR|nr:hypothetical protein [Portunus trituberculatus]